MARASKKAGRYWMYGRHAVQAALANPLRICHRLCYSGQLPEAWLRDRPGLRHEKTDVQQLQRWVGVEAVHQGVALEVEPLQADHLEDYARLRAPLLLLDQVTDPHNVGAMLRSAAAFGVKALISPKDHAPSESGVMAKAASGGLETVALVSVTNLAQAINLLKNHDYWVAGLAAHQPSTVDALKQYQPLALVMGAEGKGLRRLTQEACDVLVSIPMSGEMESLNVSNAAAIALYSMQR